MKQFAGIPNHRNNLHVNRSFIQTTFNQEVLYNELQEWKGRSSP